MPEDIIKLHFYEKLRKLLASGKINSRVMLYKKLNFVYLTTSIYKINRPNVGPLRVVPSEDHERLKKLCQNPKAEAYAIVYECNTVLTKNKLHT